MEHFRGGDRNFLTPAAGPLGPDTILDISHESLIRQWVNLDGWAKEEAKSAETYRLLEKTAAEWSEPWTGTNLDRVLEWKRTQKPNAAWAARYGGDFVRAMNFIEVGLEQRKKAGKRQGSRPPPRGAGPEVQGSCRRGTSSAVSSPSASLRTPGGNEHRPMRTRRSPRMRGKNPKRAKS